jgi:hypothetical protein
MSRNSAGTYSLPSGNPVVSGTTVSTTWANNTLTDLATEVSNSLDRQGRGVMLAPLQATDGTASAPGITFGSETNSGLYRSASGDIAFVIAGVVVARWTAAKSVVATLEAGTATVDGNITLAGSNPAATTAFQNVITKKNVPKAWANIRTNGSGGVSVQDGFNVASVAIVGSNTSVQVTFAQPFLNANYAVFGCCPDPFVPAPAHMSNPAAKTTALCNIWLRDITASGSIANNLNTTVKEFYVEFYGAQ